MKNEMLLQFVLLVSHMYVKCDCMFVGNAIVSDIAIVVHWTYLTLHFLAVGWNHFGMNHRPRPPHQPGSCWRPTRVQQSSKLLESTKQSISNTRSPFNSLNSRSVDRQLVGLVCYLVMFVHRKKVQITYNVAWQTNKCLLNWRKGRPVISSVFGY